MAAKKQFNSPTLKSAASKGPVVVCSCGCDALSGAGAGAGKVAAKQAAKKA